MFKSQLDYIAHILVVDDDDRIRMLIKKYLVKEGFLVSLCPSAIEAEQLVLGISFDLIILDKMMPKKDGFEFVKDLRNLNNLTPVIMLTAMSDISSRIDGLSNGADDYLAKPFEPRELLLKIKNILKRTKANYDTNILQFNEYSYNKTSGIVQKYDEKIKLTSNEKILMDYFISCQNKIVLRAELTKILNINDERGVDVIITRLRRKIEKNIKFPEFILTIRNLGYKLVL